MNYVKVVLVGDGGVGKKSFIYCATTGIFSTGYVPTVLDNFDVNMIVKSKPFRVTLWDVCRMEDYDRLRPLVYRDADVFVILFDVGRRSSFQNVTEKWFPEVRHFEPNAPILLLATKTDLRNGK